MATTFHCKYTTASANTAFTAIVPPLAGHVPNITAGRIRTAATSHQWSFMRTIAVTSVTTTAQAGQAVVEVADVSALHVHSSGADLDLASGDWVIYELDNGNLEANEVSSISGQNVTFNNNLGDDVVSGATMYLFGAPSRVSHELYTTKASDTDILTGANIMGGVRKQTGDLYSKRISGSGDPMLIYCPNATNAAELLYAAGPYVPDTDSSTT